MPQDLGSSGTWLFPSMSPFLPSVLAVSPEVPSAGHVGLMAGFRGFASNKSSPTGGQLTTVEAPGYPRHPTSIIVCEAVG